MGTLPEALWLIAKIIVLLAAARTVTWLTRWP